MIKSKINFYIGLFCIIVAIIPPYTGFIGFLSGIIFTMGILNIALSFIID